MIIQCPNCNKKFNVNSNLIPNEGREIQCGSCNHIWHFNIEDFLENITPTVNNIEEQTQESNIKIEKVVQENDVKIEEQIITPKNKKKPKTTVTNNSKNFKKNLNSIKKISNIRIDKFFSYLLVFVISFVALIVLLDTIKSPLINFFPRLEFLLFNLFEILKDIKSFIIDLT